MLHFLVPILMPAQVARAFAAARVSFAARCIYCLSARRPGALRDRVAAIKLSSMLAGVTGGARREKALEICCLLLTPQSHPVTACYCMYCVCS